MFSLLMATSKLSKVSFHASPLFFCPLSPFLIHFFLFQPYDFFSQIFAKKTIFCLLLMKSNVVMGELERCLEVSGKERGVSKL